MSRIAPNAPLPGIEHIVVLMLENRSFDNVFGTLYPPTGDFWGIPPDAGNRFEHDFKPHVVFATNIPPSGNSPYITPSPDPGEPYDDMTSQIFGYDGSKAPNMSGFAQNYHDIHLLHDIASVGDIMFHFNSNQMIFSSALAKMFAVSDQWFASGPVQTFPNRMFCHCATPSLSSSTKSRINDQDYIVRIFASGIEHVAGAVTDKSVFELLDGGGSQRPQNWKVYFHDMPLSVINAYVNDAWNAKSPCVTNYDKNDYSSSNGSTFAYDVENNTLPTYAFIEPRYYDNVSQSSLPANSNHPGDSSYPFGGPQRDVRHGELLVLDVFATLASNRELFEKTLLIVTYDEHGGTFDHVPPNTGPFEAPAPSPFTTKVENFDYTRYGVRVPAFFCNPRIAAGSVYRPTATGLAPPRPFDHTSIIATLCAQFGLKGPLTPRDEAAPVFANLIARDAPARIDFDLARLQALAKQMDAPLPAATPGPRKTQEEMAALLLGHAKRALLKAERG